jgi:hypothetical protein
MTNQSEKSYNPNTFFDIWLKATDWMGLPDFINEKEHL